MLKSESINELAAALAKAQAEFTSAKKDKVNPFFHSKYADIGNVIDASRVALTKYGLAVVQTSYETERGVYLTTMLLHASGQWISGDLPVRPTKNDPQGLGSALTYMRRYGLQTILCIAAEDDDGESAVDRTSKPHTRQEPVVKPAKAKQSAEPSVYTIPFGPHKGKSLQSLDPDELMLYGAKVLLEGKEKGFTRDKMSDAVKEFLVKAEAQLGMTFEP